MHADLLETVLNCIQTIQAIPSVFTVKNMTAGDECKTTSHERTRT